MELSDDKNREEAMKKIQRSIIFVIGILLWVMQGQSVFAAGSAEIVERYNCKYNDQLSVDSGWNTDDLQR